MQTNRIHKNRLKSYKLMAIFLQCNLRVNTFSVEIYNYLMKYYRSIISYRRQHSNARTYTVRVHLKSLFIFIFKDNDKLINFVIIKIINNAIVFIQIKIILRTNIRLKE